MKYPDVEVLAKLSQEIRLHADLKTEYGAKGVAELVSGTRRMLQSALTQLKRLPVDADLEGREPNGLASIRKLRPKGPRRITRCRDVKAYRNRVEGALLARMAGCTLGSPVEGWPIEKMKALAEENGDPFPPADYWSRVPDPKTKRYRRSRREAYTRRGIVGVPVDDDLAYTLLGLLIAEDHGPDFTTEHVGEAWMKYLPYACTAEEVALGNLRKGIATTRAGVSNNPYCQWIGAGIRADPWGYMAAGWPERAAEMAYRDAFLSHRRQGIYGAMFFAAAIASAFETDDPVAAIRIGLTEIPRQCGLSKAVRWALRMAPRVANYLQAREAVDVKFRGMHPVHTINNACLTVWGITIGGTDVSRVIGETVAMGLDNDCNAATAGSIVGAVAGKQGIPSRWYRNFNNTINCYLIGRRRFSIRGTVKRFARQAEIIHRQ